MKNIEIPLGKRTKTYRFFEVLPGVMSISAILLLLILSIFSPTAAAIYILLLVLTTFVRAVAVAYRTIQGKRKLDKTRAVDWRKWLKELESPAKNLQKYQKKTPAKFPLKKLFRESYETKQHVSNLWKMSQNPGNYPKAKKIINVDIVALYNESYDVLGPTMKKLATSKYDVKNNLVVVIAYEERGGAAAEKTVAKIRKNWTGKFREILFVKHPANMPGEVVGKGANISYAGKKVAAWVKKQKISPENVIITTQDCDNWPDEQYFSRLTYEWIVTENRQNAAFQPVCLFTNNIWDVPAPMRVIATGNSFWNVISSMRSHTLRNFAAHSQGLQALIDMDFWSRRTIVEDGHQYWRSFFHFDGDYQVISLHMSIGQDAVLAEGYWRTLKAQFIQLRRWDYGASDIAFVATTLLRKDCKVNKFVGWAHFFRLLDSHVSLACLPPIVALGAFAPLFINPIAAHASIIANNLPLIVAQVQQIAMIGILVTVVASFAMLPPRPKHYKATRSIMMVLQWILIPINALVYNSAAAYTAQIRLMTARYMEKFDVTEKAVRRSKK